MKLIVLYYSNLADKMELVKFGGTGPVLYVCLRGVSQSALVRLESLMGSLGDRHIIYGRFSSYNTAQNACIAYDRKESDDVSKIPAEVLETEWSCEDSLYYWYGHLLAEQLICYINEHKIEKIVMLGCSVGSTILQYACVIMDREVDCMICCAPHSIVYIGTHWHLFWNIDDDKIPFQPNFEQCKKKLISPICHIYPTGGHDFPSASTLLEFPFMQF